MWTTALSDFRRKCSYHLQLAQGGVLNRKYPMLQRYQSRVSTLTSALNQMRRCLPPRNIRYIQLFSQHFVVQINMVHARCMRS